MNCKYKNNNENIFCNRESYEDEYCIFHKHNKNNNENKEFLKRIREERISDFSGFVFEEYFNANEVIDYEVQDLNFIETIFKKEAIFNGYEFRGRVYFKYVKFYDYVSFGNAIFNNNVIFYKTIFNNVYINEKIFEKSKFRGQNLIINEVINLPRMDGIIFNSCSKFILHNIDYKKENYLIGKINYKIARNQANNIGDYERIGHYYYKERIYRSKSMNVYDYHSYRDYLSEKFFDRLSKYTIGYGERPWNIFIITLLIISMFALMYMFLDIRNIYNEEIGLNLNNLENYSLYEIIKIYIDLWYFSMVTFSTVGYGDIIVTSLLGKILVSVEVFLGVTIGAAWASVIIKRMIR